MSHATVSVLIPVYNGADYIENAVQCVLHQKDVTVEVIVIDDGSTDRTPEILRTFGDAIRVVRQANAGHVRARNHGATFARGDWLAFLDADDEWLPEKLVRQLARADGRAGLVYTDRQNFGEIGRIHELASEAVPLFEGDVFEPLLLGNFITVSSGLIRRDWFDRLGGFDDTLLVCEDWDLWLRFSAAGGWTAVCREPLTRYRWHADSMTFNQERMCAGRLKVVHKALATPRGRTLSHAARRRALAATWRTSAWYAAPSQPWTALKWYWRAFRWWPLDRSVYRGAAKCCLASVGLRASA
jgi:glycosyltransferase involved in cell wall biosynthesis